MDTSSNEGDSFNWNTEDELEIDGISSSSTHQEQIADYAPSSSSYTLPSSKIIDQFLIMGFSREMIIKAVKENGENNEEAVLDALLAYPALENSPEKEHGLDNPRHVEPQIHSQDVLSDEEIGENEESTNAFVGKDEIVSILVEMGYQAEEALDAIDKCGITNISCIDTTVEELSEFIVASQFASDDGDARCHQQQNNKRKRPIKEDDEVLHLPNPMIGFGVRNEPSPRIHRRVPDEAQGHPYFYFENVAITPKGVWKTMSEFLYDIEPEFVDSKFFCAATRKRGYIRNLPIHNRFQLLALPLLYMRHFLIHRSSGLLGTQGQLNCLLTSVSSSKLANSIKEAVERSGDEPSPSVKKYVIVQCKRWNLIWVGRNKVASLEPQEMEMIMGFPANHTRGGGITRKEQYTALGNTIRVDTVAYHLSVLKNMFPDGINVLSLFSGIGGAEVALHRLGIRLKNVVSVEISEACREVLQSWWMQTNQQGNLIHFPDVQMVTEHQLETWMSKVGGFDLIIGGSPCNNLAGRNQTSRDGLEGEKSSLFFDYQRIVRLVRNMMRR